MRLFDGDRIAVLLAVYVAKQLQDSFPELKFRLVQTAYANGGSTGKAASLTCKKTNNFRILNVLKYSISTFHCTDYVRDVLKVGVDIAKTGVKFVHHKAEESDIGIYFEVMQNALNLVLHKIDIIEFSISNAACWICRTETGQWAWYCVV